MVLIKLVNVGIDCVNVLPQPLPLGLETSRSVKRPDNQGATLLEPADDFGRDPIDGSFDAPDHLRAIPSNRDRLGEHRCRRDDDLGGAADVKFHEFRRDPMRGIGRRRRDCNAPRRAGCRSDRRRSVGANEPAAGSGGGGLFDWSRS